ACRRTRLYSRVGDAYCTRLFTTRPYRTFLSVPEGPTMDVRCDKCQARYRIDDARLGPQGLPVRRGKWGNTLRAKRESAPASASPGRADPVRSEEHTSE